MAGDWIKMRTNLDSDPRVFAMSEALGVHDLHVVGLLWKVWAWADQHTQDGNAVSVTDARIDRIVEQPGFAKALRKVGWLDGRDSALTFPRFAEHNGKTAKSRAQTSDRVKRNRNASSVTEALPEKRREEKSITHTHTPKKSGSGFEPHPAWAERWQAWIDTWEARTGSKFNEILAEQQGYKLHELPPDKAEADLKFSLEKMGKSLLDSENDFSKRKATSGNAPKRKGLRD